MKLNGDRISPVKHLVLRNMSASREEDKEVVNEVVERVRPLHFILPYKLSGKMDIFAAARVKLSTIYPVPLD